MLEKRSREFATYLLIGLKKKHLSRLYMKENLLIGTAALLLGIGLGTLLQQIIMTVFYSVFSEDYHLRIQMNGWCLSGYEPVLCIPCLICHGKTCGWGRIFILSRFRQEEKH